MQARQGCHEVVRQESSSDDGESSVTSSAIASRRSSECDSGVGYLSEYEGLQQAARVLGMFSSRDKLNIYTFALRNF